ncbi:hypothetical protein ROZALSC1DRAFT_31586 [Rozella allomycis CSF55]|uniref:Uncharacterized protein n=1 Tax=Rozella allomycis (strain CSF55) TaxID=988480 RepID=A0A4P9YBY7_ROZAC|nr:hypothetical protein ROZALSC1DRAFT_31586 [Rozella allomycis CSF55]
MFSTEVLENIPQTVVVGGIILLFGYSYYYFLSGEKKATESVPVDLPKATKKKKKNSKKSCVTGKSDTDTDEIHGVKIKEPTESSVKKRKEKSRSQSVSTLSAPSSENLGQLRKSVSFNSEIIQVNSALTPEKKLVDVFASDFGLEKLPDEVSHKLMRQLKEILSQEQEGEWMSKTKGGNVSIKSLLEKNESLNKEISALNSTLMTERAEVKLMTNKFAIEEKKHKENATYWKSLFEQLKNENNLLKNKLREMDMIVKNAQEQVGNEEALHTKISQLENHCEELKRKNSILDHQSKSQTVAMSQLKAEVESLKSKENSILDKSKQFEDAHQEQSLIVEKLQKSFNLQENEIESLKRSLTEKDVLVNDLNVTVENLKSVLLLKEKENSSLSSQIEELNSFTVEHQDVLTQLKHDKRELEAENAKLVEDSASLKNHFESEISKLHENQKIERQNVIDLTNRIEELQSIIKEKDEIIQNKTMENDTDESAAADISTTDKLDSLKQLNMDLIRKLSESEKKHKSYVAESIEKINNMQKEIDLLKGQ